MKTRSGGLPQSGWDQHVAFIDQLSQDGKIPLGGPVGAIDGQHAVVVVHAHSEDEARTVSVARYSASASPEPPSSSGKSLSFGRPSFMGSTVDS